MTAAKLMTSGNSCHQIIHRINIAERLTADPQVKFAKKGKIDEHGMNQ